MKQPAFLLFRNIHRRPGSKDAEYIGSITAGGVNYRIEADVVEPSADGSGARMAHFAGRLKRTGYAPSRRNGQADFDQPLAGASSAPDFDDPIP